MCGTCTKRRNKMKRRGGKGAGRRKSEILIYQSQSRTALLSKGFFSCGKKIYTRPSTSSIVFSQEQEKQPSDFQAADHQPFVAC
ncbi:hypothetical protein GDO81_012324 [Engystomops pustulosus]|uniref:Uncharacterized protein n=1 Tax=Engystomops pustulosus TaxID=76066 RepID=A0AAV7BLD6_ENGPU|nr:hypothetical protein GDO81_012324 [Engystomops pustulosus]